MNVRLVGPADRRQGRFGVLRSTTSCVALLAALALAIAGPTPGYADKRRPTISTPKQCTIDAVGGQATLSCDGLICSCCYSDGCYICDKDGKDCVWDPGHSAGRRPGAVSPGGGVLDPGTITPLFVPKVPPTGGIAQ